MRLRGKAAIVTGGGSGFGPGSRRCSRRRVPTSSWRT
jgi:hypothetical protein